MFPFPGSLSGLSYPTANAGQTMGRCKDPVTHSKNDCSKAVQENEGNLNFIEWTFVI